MLATILDPVHLRAPRSAYVHVPFCVHRCGYCDFTLVAGKDQLIDDYLRALALQLRSVLGDERPELDTLYFGGGTPTHLSVTQLERLFTLVASHVRLTPGAEFTVEANPVDLDAERIDRLAAAGVNRISLGVQSFDADILALLERDHREPQIVAGLERLRARIDNVSIDLIFGVPGQSLDLWRTTLEQAISLRPRHVSTYGLTFERGTAFWSRREKGLLRPAPEELEGDMYALAMEQLPAAGWEQYEISSFATAGFRSRHNQVYWSGLPYHGFGPGAARYLQGIREREHRSVTNWLANVLAGRSTVAEREQLSDEDRARERLVLGLRRTEGIEGAQFSRETGFAFRELAGPAMDRFLQQGLLEERDGWLRLSRAGRFVADAVIVELL